MKVCFSVHSSGMSASASVGARILRPDYPSSLTLDETVYLTTVYRTVIDANKYMVVVCK